MTDQPAVQGNTKKRRSIPAELRPESVVAVIDNREQLPLDLSPLQTVRGTLATGDYGLAAAPGICSLERKTLPDLIGCIGAGRERFERELVRLRAYETRAVVVEAHWPELERGHWRGRVTAQAAVGSVLGWIAGGIPFLFVGDHEAAGRVVAKMLFIAARRRYREGRALLGSTLEVEKIA